MKMYDSNVSAKVRGRTIKSSILLSYSLNRENLGLKSFLYYMEFIKEHGRNNVLKLGLDGMVQPEKP